MTSSGAAEELPFIAAMEREPPNQDWQEATVTVKAGDVFRGDGMMWELLRKIGQALGMVSMPERGPDPDYADAEAIASRGAPRVAISGGGQYGPKSDWPRRRNAIIDGLLIAGIIALVSTSVYLLKTTVRLDTQYSERGQLYDYRFRSIEGSNERQDAALGRHDERLNRLEQQRRDAVFNANDQQGNR